MIKMAKTKMKSKVLLTLLFWTQWIGIMTFLYGFFPLKILVDGDAQAEDIPEKIK